MAFQSVTHQFKLTDQFFNQSLSAFMEPDSPNFHQEQEFLFGRINYEKSTARSNSFKTRSMQQLLDLLGNPQLQLQTIHVAGTKGKGSISAMIGEALSQAGCKTGIYSSPHLDSICERFVIDGRLVSEQHLAQILSRVRSAVEIIDQRLDSDPELRPPTFFEICTAAAFLLFQAAQCNWIVLEVGLGGRLDSTNLCQPRLSVITNISFDHMKQLGTTLHEIAFEKAGIIKPSIPVICGERHPEAMDVIHRVAAEQNSPVIQAGRDFDWHGDSQSGSVSIAGRLQNRAFEINGVQSAMAGKHQIENAALATVVLKYLERGEPALSNDVILKGVRSAQLPGRCEILPATDEQPHLLFDMAHNVASAEALADTVQDWTASHRVSQKVLVFAASRDKDIRGILDALVQSFDTVILTRFQQNPRAASLVDLESFASEFDRVRVLTAPTPAEAWTVARQVVERKTRSTLLCVAGSAFLCAELRPLIFAEEHQESCPM